MKSDARLLLNKKKWKNASSNRKIETWTGQGGFKSRNSVDARKILNLKRSQKSQKPVYGSYMRTKTATAFIASQIRKEIAPTSRGEQKQVQLSKDGNIIITSKSKKSSEYPHKVASRGGLQRMGIVQPAHMQYEPSTSTADDLEYTALEDLMDLDSLPPEFVSSKTLPTRNLSRKSVLNQVLEKKNTMIADQLTQSPTIVCAKVYVSNLHRSVSQEDVMELFSDVGIIKNAEIIMPGTAIIDFYETNDAQKACDIYHNRLLDGLPMKCYLQTQKPQTQKSAIAQRLGERVVAGNTPIQRAVPAAVTSNPRSRINPRNVQFTVKLT